MRDIRIANASVRTFAGKALVLLAVLLFGTAVMAQTYPSRPIKLIVGFGAGGVSDVIARLTAEEMGRRLGQPVVVENRPGAGGLIAAQAVKNAPADGAGVEG